ncbi:MAG: amylo-alpha-1,6-glucosidase [Bradymonadaceae bacterium]|nr:amylo-alpha-1,6-glucosidase [Lujinxingiaceae bacterium]
MPHSIDYHILATSTLTDDRIRVLKHSDMFAVFNRYGDILRQGLDGVHGIYLADMRHLSRLELRVAGCRPLLLSSTVKEDNAVMTVDMTNPDLEFDGVRLNSDTVHILRTKFLLDNSCYEEIRLHNFGKRALTLPLTLSCEGDFADIFELRGTRRDARGIRGEVRLGRNSITHSYLGLDGVHRETVITYSPMPSHVAADHVRFEVHLEPGWEAAITMTIDCLVKAEHGLLEGSEPGEDGMAHAIPLHQTTSTSYADAFQDLSGDAKVARMQACDVRTSNDLFDRWSARSSADLHMLTTQTLYGPYVYAGTPWYSTVFGRDGLITAYQCLWVMPQLARGVLSFLAAHQATQLVDAQDAEPGKIIHEMRRSEMALVNEVPFQRYYGSIDATPLFIWLAGAYYKRTADLAFIEQLWPAIERAVDWIDNWGARNGSGYVAYHKRADKGLLQQGWKDSEDSVFHADGTIAEPPIALCEVQAYVYGARLAAARLATALQREGYAQEQRRKAERLSEQFERDFWCEDLGLYALAIDGNGRRCEVRSSNAGHCLLTGIASPTRAARITAELMKEDFYSGWGIRTLACNEVRYNPLSYHNGSIWPHDNALIAAGMGRYGFRDQVLRLLEDFFMSSRFFDLHRLPELFCGFARRQGEGPTLYPVACSPQAWAAGSIYLFLQAAMGLVIDAAASTVTFYQPRLPASLREVELRNLSVAGASLDILIKQHVNDTGVEVIARTGNVKVLVVK